MLTSIGYSGLWKHKILPTGVGSSFKSNDELTNKALENPTHGSG